MSRSPRNSLTSRRARRAASTVATLPRGSVGLPVAVVFRALMTLPQRDRRP